jgi:Ribonuclease G/E
MALREIQLYLSRNKATKIRVSMAEEVCLYVLNMQKRHLLRLEQEFSSEILIVTSPALKIPQTQIETVGSE